MKCYVKWVVHAACVDAEARFPAEAVEAMRDAGLLGAWIDRSLGGLGVSIEQIAWACSEIGQRCASSAMGSTCRG